ncbi:uncharacterized protein [Hoplias malabaricus]|uniref:uncharacterized protein isoform X2 n=1 Tax=Hoplias malabaricus TaxID=27720 RepID=UPI003462F7AB
MAEDSSFASDYDFPCPLCDEEDERHYLRHRVSERKKKKHKEREEPELKIVNIKEDENIENKKKEKGNVKIVEEKEEQKIIKADDIFKHGKSAEVEKDDESKVEKLKVMQNDAEKETNASPPQDDSSVLQLDSGCPVNLVMVCEESVEKCVSEELMLCPSKALMLPQIPSLSPSPSDNPLALTVPPSNAPLYPLQTQPLVQNPASVQMPRSEAQCIGNRVYSSSPSADPKTLVPPGQMEVTLRQVYTRRYTRFTRGPTPLLPLPSGHPDSSSKPLPYITSTTLLPSAPKKKTRTSYSVDQLEELERVFQDDHYPDAEKRKEIAISVGVTPQRVMVWFQNRRAKWRKTSKTAAKKPPVSRTSAPAPVPVHQPAPIHRPPVFTAPPIAPMPSQTGNTLPSYSALLSSCTSPPELSPVDGGNVCLSQGGVDYKLPIMQSPPPLRRASLPFFAAYNPPTHTLSVLLDTPEHSEPQLLSLHTDSGFDYDGLGSSAKMESVTSGAGSRIQSYQINAYPQQPGTVFPQQPNTLLSQQGNNIIPQQSNPLRPQHSHLSYLTPSLYLTPNPSDQTTSSCLPLNSGTTSSLLACTNGGHAYFQCQNGNQILLQPGVHGKRITPKPLFTAVLSMGQRCV